MSDRLNHYTFNTGDLAPRPGAEVSAEVFTALQPALASAAPSAPIPALPDWHLAILRPSGASGPLPDDGRLFFQFAREPGLSRSPAIMAMACWDAGKSAAAWELIVMGYRTMEPALRPIRAWQDPPPQPPAVPWLAVYFTPFLYRHPMRTMVLGELERGVAWAAMTRQPIPPGEEPQPGRARGGYAALLARAQRQGDPEPGLG